MAAPLRIGTRGSPLALWQAEWVQRRLAESRPELATRIDIIRTTGDRIRDVPLSQIGESGLFIKEIETALLEERIDIAVHSMKDMPARLADGLCMGPVPLRASSRDALIARSVPGLADLPHGARVGTSSLRRSAQLRHHRPDLSIEPLRGNVDTRLRKLHDDGLDAIVLAAAGLIRLGLSATISEALDPGVMLPAVGQGALCIEHVRERGTLASLLEPLDHVPTRLAVTAERAFLARLEGSCQVPVAAHATVAGGTLHIDGLVADVSGTPLFRGRRSGPVLQAAQLGDDLAEDLLARGAQRIIERLTSPRPS